MNRPPLSQKAERFTESVIREMTRLARLHGAVNLAQGMPDFPAPAEIKEAACRAIMEDVNQYAITWGAPRLRAAIAAKTGARWKREIDPEREITVTCGSTEAMIASLLAVVDPGDEVVIFEPFYENYGPDTVLSGAVPRFVPLRPPDWSFDPGELERAFNSRTRAVILNTPNNPTGTAIDAAALESLSRGIVAENVRRKAAGRAPVYLMFDQVYWMLTAPGTRHVNPVSLVPEMAAYTIFVDGISKAFAATGLRVGWAVGPTDVIERMAAILTHIGAWAPRAEQVATAQLLNDTPAVDTFLAHMNREVFERLDILANGVRRLAAAGHPVEAVAPAGAIYLSVRVGIAGRTTSDGKLLATDEDIRGFLLKHAGLAVVPFQAFGVKKDSGWFRASIGAVSKRELEQGLLRLEKALASLRA